jgi:hypothetical protein
MKVKLLTVALLSGLVSVSSHAIGFDQFGDPSGAMNVYNNNAGTRGDWQWYSGWGLADLQSITTDNRTFELLPNINCYDATNEYWSAGDDGNKWMEATTLFEASSLSANQTNATFTFDVEAFDLDERYTLEGFIKVLNPNTDYSVSTSTAVTISNSGPYSLSLTLSDTFNNFEGMVLQIGWVMGGVNANPATDWGAATITATSIGIQDNDADAPSPDPMQFYTVPYAASDSAISMTAVTAADAENGVEYYFACTSGGGHDSGWQSNTNYTDTTLAPNTLYTYTVTARDTSSQANETAASAASSATTLGGDVTSPSPDPAAFAATEASPVSIKLTAVTATDESAVEYFFDCTAGDGTDSGWQSSPVYIDTGLAPGSNYTYTVTVRDLSSATNTTAASSPVEIATTPLPGSYSLSSSLQGFTGNNTLALTQHELAKAGFQLASTDAEQLVTFGSSGATFGDSATWGSRNVLSTLAQDYGDADFEVYATLITENTTEQAGFIGVGQGIIGAWGVPDMELEGVNATVAEIQGSWCKVFTWIDGVSDGQLVETDGISTYTNRVRMVHDSAAQTIRFELDADYAGGAFVADRVLGTHSTTNLWEDMPQRITLGAGAGVLWKDVEITASSQSIVAVDDLIILSATAAGTQLYWSSEFGQTYDVYYTTNLAASASWTVDPSAGCSGIAGTGGNLSATSTVGAPVVFYKIGTEL